MTKIETERLILRNITENDACDIFEYGKEANVGPNAGWKPHKNIDETKDIMKNVFINQQYVFGIVLKENNKMIGSVGLIKDPKRENPHALMLGYAISEKYWGQGIVPEASKAIIKLGFENPEIDIITCCCYSFNKRSRRVIEKCGFMYEGCLRNGEMRYDGEVFDIESFSLLKKETL
ncbi:MAG TPA: GNAT family N-acetyltransferase [Prevotella sp.]|nr:GNAT family N-acetyltransferase [Prevotella sp.]